ncbi:hypothetical protein [Bdellovibrio sp. NC01]|uniref:hypothetical protein n=1 Tax=Bdellovibrio sp. NC01 TaxID=2220073 RepID=UPI001158C660|nr:hypothetical protein [Bdellovibrio sp. NC01]QDK38702.1 hypothetical protein DOE51_14465 [Bdellovibrio sp. NC01]
MKYLLLFPALFLCGLAHAENISDLRKAAYENLSSCGQAVTSDDSFLAASLSDIGPHQGRWALVNLQTKEQSLFPANDTIVDIKLQDGKAFILTETTFEAWDLKNKTQLYSYASHPEVGTGSKWSKKATGFVFRAGKALIAHGVLGFSLLNPETGVVEKTIALPTVSSAQDITLIEEKKALVAVDNADEAEFRGLYVLDLSSLDIVKQIKIDNAYPLSIRSLPGNRLMIGYLNAIWKFDLAAALKGQEANPNRRSWKFPGLFDVDMRGKVFYDNDNLYSCFGVFQDGSGAITSRKNTPLAFKLSDLKLN